MSQLIAIVVKQQGNGFVLEHEARYHCVTYKGGGPSAGGLVVSMVGS